MGDAKILTILRAQKKYVETESVYDRSEVVKEKKRWGLRCKMESASLGLAKFAQKCKQEEKLEFEMQDVFCRLSAR